MLIEKKKRCAYWWPHTKTQVLSKVIKIEILTFCDGNERILSVKDITFYETITNKFESGMLVGVYNTCLQSKKIERHEQGLLDHTK